MDTVTEGGTSTTMESLTEGGIVDFEGRRWKTLFITPEMAKDILDERNTKNRNPSERNISKFARDMAANKWRTGNGETIKFKADQSLADGQNRLFALVRASELNPDFEGLSFVIVEGVTDEDMATIDTGKSRTFGDVLKLDGETNTYQLSSAVNALFYYYYPEREHRMADRPTHEELKAFFAEHSNLRDHIGESVKIANNTGLARPTCAAFGYEIERLHGKDFAPWNSFREKLITGYDIAPGDPVGALRNFGLQGTVRLRGDNRSFRRDTMIGMAKAWNAVMRGDEIRRIKVGDNEDVPTVL